MRQDCAALASAQQSREDGLVQTITQISSAAILAIPGVLLSSDIEVPTFREGWLLYLGTIMFLLALTASMLEQYFSAQSYRKHEEIAKSYYFLDTNKDCDKYSIARVDATRIIACVLFGVALLLSATGIIYLMEKEHDKPATSSSASAASAAAAAAVASSVAAVPTARIRRQGNTEVSPVTDPAAAKEIAKR